MNVQLVSFSPTRTTQTVLTAIANALEPTTLSLSDWTHPAVRRAACEPPAQQAGVREQAVPIKEPDLWLYGSPVYAGRLPAVVTETLRQLPLPTKPRPAFALVTYGNRDMGVAL